MSKHTFKEGDTVYGVNPVWFRQGIFEIESTTVKRVTTRTLTLNDWCGAFGSRKLFDLERHKLDRLHLTPEAAIAAYREGLSARIKAANENLVAFDEWVKSQDGKPGVE